MPSKNAAAFFNQVIEEIIQIEVGNKPNGGYTDDPKDNGGKTKWGITEAVYRDAGYFGEIVNAPKSLAEEIYRRRYISGPQFDQIAEINLPIGKELIDTGVNMGTHIAASLLQRWLNAFNLEGSGVADLHVDGVCGSLSRAALTQFLAKRGVEGEGVMLRALNGSQADRYLRITESDKSQRRFVYGWVRARVLIV